MVPHKPEAKSRVLSVGVASGRMNGFLPNDVLLMNSCWEKEHSNSKPCGHLLAQEEAGPRAITSAVRTQGGIL